MGPAPALSPPRGDIARTEKTAALPSDKAFTMDISLSSSKQLKTSFYVPKEVASTSYQLSIERTRQISILNLYQQNPFKILDWLDICKL